MKSAPLIIIAASGALLFAAASSTRGNVESGDGSASIDFQNITDQVGSIVNRITEQPADVTPDQAAANVAAMLGMIRQSEGTAEAGNPYAVCYAYRHTVADFSNHPSITGEWPGEVLPDAMCKNAGFGPGCKSTAAGAYQIIRPTWKTIMQRLGLPDFSPASQDAAAVELIRSRGALEDVKAGRIDVAIDKCKNEWASLPGNYAQQGQHSRDNLIAWYVTNGGSVA